VALLLGLAALRLRRTSKNKIVSYQAVLNIEEIPWNRGLIPTSWK